MNLKCKECGDCIKDEKQKFKNYKLCKVCYEELYDGIIRPAFFTIGQNPCGDGRGDDFSFEIAVREYERE